MGVGMPGWARREGAERNTVREVDARRRIQTISLSVHACRTHGHIPREHAIHIQVAQRARARALARSLESEKERDYARARERVSVRVFVCAGVHAVE